MDLLHLETGLAALLFTGVRVSGVMVFAPFLGSQSVSMPVKAGLTLGITGLLFPLHHAPALPGGVLAGAGIVLAEFGVGLVLGLTLNFIFDAVEFAGQMVGMQMGFSLVNVIDPQTQVDTPVLSIFHQLITLLIFLELNVHHWLLRGLGKSFAYLPAGSIAWLETGGPALIRAAGSIGLAGLQMAAPVLLATVVADVTLGFLAKASPQLPVLFFGLSIKSVLSLLVMIAAVVFWPRMLERHFMDAIATGERFLQLAR